MLLPTGKRVGGVRGGPQASRPCWCGPGQSQPVCPLPGSLPSASTPAMLQLAGSPPKLWQSPARRGPPSSPRLTKPCSSAGPRSPLSLSPYSPPLRLPWRLCLGRGCPLFLELHPSRPHQIRSCAKCLQTGSRKWRVYSRHESTHKQVQSLGICGAVAWRDQIFAPTEVTLQRGQDPKQAAMKTDTLLG